MNNTPNNSIDHELSARVVAGLAAGIVAVDGNHRVLFANDAAAQHLNLPASALAAGASFSSLPGMEPFAAMIEHVVRTDAPLTREEVVLGDSELTRKEIGVSASPLSSGGDAAGAILLFSNVTQRRQRERTESLNRQLVDLGELAAGVVHQVRNPLTIITGRAELLLRQMGDERQKEYLESIINEANQIAVSLSTFLQCAKPFEFHPRDCEAQTVVDRAIQVCSKKADQKAIGVFPQSAMELDMMHVDPDRLAQALAIFIENAIDATPDGGTVEIRVRQDGPLTIFSVHDQGPGVQVKEGEDIFSPFYTQKRDGSGLGLSIALRIATLQGGAARHYNVDGGGACFELEVPTVHGRT